MVTLSEIKKALSNPEVPTAACDVLRSQWCTDRGLLEWPMNIQVMAYIEKLEQRIEDLEQLVNAVTCGEFSGISCQDVLVDGKPVNWFDQQAALQGKES